MPEFTDSLVAQLELRGGKQTEKGKPAGKNRGVVVVGHALVLDDPFTNNVLRSVAWCLNRYGYPLGTFKEGGQCVKRFLHLVVWDHYRAVRDPLLQIDHRDRNPLNALPENLREVTRTLNRMNTGKRCDNTSGYKNVYRCGRTGKWRAIIQVDKKQLPLGSFVDIRDAARAVNAGYRIHCPGVSVPNPEVEHLR